MMLQNHWHTVLRPLQRAGYAVDLYMYTDAVNTYRRFTWKPGDTPRWEVEPVPPEVLRFMQKGLERRCTSMRMEVEDEPLRYHEEDYTANLRSQLHKWVRVLQMVPEPDAYAHVLRVRPDIYWDDSFDVVSFLRNADRHTIYQNDEGSYQGDAVQVFAAEHLAALCSHAQHTITQLAREQTTQDYEKLLNAILTAAGLRIEWVPRMAYRWYARHARHFRWIDMRFFDDWINREYALPFDPAPVHQALRIRRGEPGLLRYPSAHHVPETPLCRAALDPDCFVPCATHPPHDVVGLLPCCGTASRMQHLPKFVLPCPGGTLMERTLQLFAQNLLQRVYVAISPINAKYVRDIQKRFDPAEDVRVRCDVLQTATMSETVVHLTDEVPASKYILAMPDTYVHVPPGQSFGEVQDLCNLLDGCHVALLLWRIKPHQRGKLGQVEVDENGRVLRIRDKDPSCTFPYAWGMAGWTSEANTLLDSSTPHVGYMFEAALAHGLEVRAIISQTRYFDCGTPDEYFEMIRTTTAAPSC